MEVAPSTVNGLGVFTTKSFLEGSVVCKFSGFRTSDVHACKDSGKQRITVLDKSTGLECFLDSTGLENSCGRYINDARYTGYDYNVSFSDYVSEEPDPITGKYYIVVIALCDIPEGVELFVDYTKKYWESEVMLSNYDKLIA